ncbi:hypothetical protein ACLH0B_17705 [Aeromonas salmonicida]|uniref:hypothetical protein n=1 Tax=Aeromonas salmonicida TaxID=645 RepID=UPI003D07D819
MGVSGLAEGFLAGFNTMDRYQRGQKEDERMDKAMGLRDAMWQNAQEQQKKADVRYEDETKYSRDRDAIGDKRDSLEYAGRQRQLELENKRANAMLSLNVEQNKRAQESHTLAVEKNKRDQWWLDNEVPFNLATDALGRGEQITPEQDALLNNEYAAGRNPYRVFGDPQWHQNANTVYNGVKGIINNPDAKVWDMGKMHGAINTPELQKALTYMVRGNLEKGIGTMTPDGVVKSYGEVEVVPTGRGTFYMQAPVTYVNPKTGESIVKDAPITEGRTGDPSDPIKEFTPQQFINHFGKAYQVSQQIQKNPEQWENFLVQTGMKPPVDHKGFRSAVSKINADTAKAISQIRRSNLSDPEKQAAIKDERAAAEAQITDTQEIFRVGGKSASTPSDEADTVSRLPEQVNGWIGGDKRKQSFIDSAVSRGFDFSTHTPEQLDNEYQSIIKKQRQQSAYEAIMGGGKP